MTNTEIIYFDDDEEDLNKYSIILKDKLSANVFPSEPPDDLTLKDLPEEADMILIDYDLGLKRKNGKIAPYRGGTLAALLREKYPDVPLVILSRPSVFIDPNFSVDQLAAADDWYYKHTLTTDQRTSAGLLSLVSGFRAIRLSPRGDWNALAKLMGAREDELDMLKEAGAPFRHIPEMKNSSWTAHELANWVRKTIMLFPGILYNKLYASTALGIDQSEFEESDIQGLFKDAEYRGVFSGANPTWWRTRLFNTAENLMSAGKLRGPIVPTFAPAFEIVHTRKLKPATCVSSGESPADAVCFVLNAPVMRKYSLEYFPDSRPSVMDTARVSFKAIREKNEFREEFLTESGRELAKKIQNE